MRIERLALAAFGPFTGHELDFSQNRHALQLVYGPNEAGKSSTLRALLGLLYGIPARTGDAHVHEMTRLRIGATLRDEDGRELAVIRRKGLKHTLLDVEERPLDEAALAPFLGGLDEALFRQMFGLDHERLREGAETLLRGGGQLGEVLFDAGTGGRGVHASSERLRAEADALYKARGRTPELNVALERVRERRKQKSDAMLSPQAFADQQRALDAARQARAQALEERRELLAEKSRLTHLLAVLPLIHRRDALTAELATLRALAQGRRAPSADQGYEEQVRELERRYGGVRAAAREEPLLRAQLEALERERAELATRLGAGLAGLAALESATRARLRKLVDEERRLRAERAELARLEAIAEEEQAHYAARAAALPEPRANELATLCAEVEREELVAALARAELELDKSGAELARRLARLGLALDLPALAAAPLPSDALVVELEQAWERSERELEREREALARVRAELARLNEARCELLAQGELASRAELEEARRARDSAFDALCTAFSRGEPAQTPLRTFAARTQQADELADRRCREAQRAAEHARLEQACAARALERAELEARLAVAERSFAELGERWRRVAAPLALPACSPRSARPLLAELARLREQWSERTSLEAQRDRLEQRARERCNELELALAQSAAGVPPGHAEAAHTRERGLPGDASGSERAPAREAGTSMNSVLARALRRAREQLLADAERARARQALCQRAQELAGTRAAHAGRQRVIERELESLYAGYRRELEALGLASDPIAALSPDELLACLDELALLAQRTREANALSARLEAGRRAGEALVGDARELARRVLGPDRDLGDSERGVEEILAALALAQRQWREATRDETRLADELAKLDEQLATLGDGAPLDVLRASVAELDPHRLRARREEIDQWLEEHGHKLGELDQALGRLEAGLERLEQVSGAVELAEDYEHELARARSLARRYVEVRLALSILTREVERYRTQHQKPLLKRASELFPRLTLGRYRGLAVEYDERDEPVLACVMASGKTLRVSGLSDGTRDQLYLALRVASLERYFEGKAPLPLVLDDVLIHFDDARAQAALAVLGELAGRTQVLFFTHHARMIELARAALGPHGVALHELGPRELRRHDGPLFEQPGA